MGTKQSQRATDEDGSRPLRSYVLQYKHTNKTNMETQTRHEN